MNANKMTQKTLETLQQAQSLAEERRNTQVGQIHVFHALLDDPDDLNAQLMASMGILRHSQYDRGEENCIADSSIQGNDELHGSGR